MNMNPFYLPARGPLKTIESTTVLAVMALMLVAGSAQRAGAREIQTNEYLDLDIAQLMNITVTSVAKKEQRLADAPAAVFVITQEDIHRSGVTTIPDALAMALYHSHISLPSP